MKIRALVISVASDIEREKSDKFCSEVLISAWGSFTCRNSTTRGPTALLPFRRKSYSGFLRSEKIHRPRPGSNPRTSDPEAGMITTGPPGSTQSLKTLRVISNHIPKSSHSAPHSSLLAQWIMRKPYHENKCECKFVPMLLFSHDSLCEESLMRSAVRALQYVSNLTLRRPVRLAGAYLRGWTNGTEPPPEGKKKKINK